MKTSAPASPRLVCRTVRGWISVFGDIAAAGENRHVADCPDCQAFFSAGDELELALRRDASPQRDFVPAGLEQSILQAVDRSARPRRRSFGLPLLSLAGLAAAAVVAFVVLQQPASRPDPARPAVDPIATELAVIANAAPSNLFSSLRPEAEALLRQDPLQNEIDAVAANARIAVRFLAANFLPPSAGQSRPGSG